MKVENITPYNGDEAKGVQVERMFDRIAPTYDALNHGMSWCVDKYWRRRTLTMIVGARATTANATSAGHVQAGDHEGRPYNRPPAADDANTVGAHPCGRPSPPGTEIDILDIATGTGDFAILAAETLKPRSIIGMDISEGMLAIGREKVEKRGLADVITFRKGDVMAIPFPEESFDIVAVAFGVRNFQDLNRGLSEIYRVLKPGGRVAIVELSSPKNALVRRLFKVYSHTVLPLAGRLFPRDAQAYRYLAASMEAFPQAETVRDILSSVGFGEIFFRRMTCGICTRYMAVK